MASSSDGTPVNNNNNNNSKARSKSALKEKGTFVVVLILYLVGRFMYSSLQCNILIFNFFFKAAQQKPLVSPRPLLSSKDTGIYADDFIEEDDGDYSDDFEEEDDDEEEEENESESEDVGEEDYEDDFESDNEVMVINSSTSQTYCIK